jgi:hypothetical protein
MSETDGRGEGWFQEVDARDAAPGEELPVVSDWLIPARAEALVGEARDRALRRLEWVDPEMMRKWRGRPEAERAALVEKVRVWNREADEKPRESEWIGPACAETLVGEERTREQRKLETEHPGIMRRWRARPEAERSALIETVRSWRERDQRECEVSTRRGGVGSAAGKEGRQAAWGDRER